VYVVDNGSADDCVAQLRQLQPGVHIISSDDNHGFAAGCNLGITAALRNGAEAVLLLNTDTLFGPGLLKTLATCPVELRDVCVSPEMFWAHRPDAVWFAGAWAGSLPGTFRPRESGHPRTQVDYLWACCMLVGRGAWERVGLLDPSYFCYYEDMDWCERARRAGVAMRINPAARLWHAAPQHDSPVRRYHRTRSSVLYDTRWASRSGRARGLRLIRRLRTSLALVARADIRGLEAHARGLVDGARLARACGELAVRPGP
jgi:hypothetical protein